MPATDIHATNAPTTTAPARNAAAITPHDTNELTAVTRGIYVGVTGDVLLVTINGHTVTFAAVPAGSILPVQAKIVKATGTTATNLTALW